MKYTIRPAEARDYTAISKLIPRLADFNVPAAREPEQLWRGDQDMLDAWHRGDLPAHIVEVAVDDNTLLGAVIVSFRDELLSKQPSSHLEVLVLDEAAQGHGIGAALIDVAETRARERGATSMSLHVFANNTRARKLYERCGFDGEVMRYFKLLDGE